MLISYITTIILTYLLRVFIVCKINFLTKRSIRHSYRFIHVFLKRPNFISSNTDETVLTTHKLCSMFAENVLPLPLVLLIAVYGPASTEGM